MKNPGIILLFLTFLISSCTDHVPTEIRSTYAQLPEQVDFNFHILPILSDKCFQCHGPDEQSRQADLRLDVESDAFAALSEGEGFAIVKGEPMQSAIIQRAFSTDPDFVMPTPASKISLSDREKALLYKWIEQGAEWKEHWAFIAPQKSTPPQPLEKEWLKNPIDAFILNQLEVENIAPSPKADKTSLIRRLSLDLIGLPPTLEEVDAFLDDTSDQAYEKLVDRLLDSPKFGERWAWDWLDAARYADTNGFQGDPERNMWPWRDWLINAINENMPYDQFTVEQLAGDLLPNATQVQILATAFNRNHMYNGEGGRIPEETRVENVFDRVETMGTLWMGLTLNSV